MIYLNEKKRSKKVQNICISHKFEMGFSSHIEQRRTFLCCGAEPKLESCRVIDLPTVKSFAKTAIDGERRGRRRHSLFRSLVLYEQRVILSLSIHLSFSFLFCFFLRESYGFWYTNMQLSAHYLYIWVPWDWTLLPSVCFKWVCFFNFRVLVNMFRFYVIFSLSYYILSFFFLGLLEDFRNIILLDSLLCTFRCWMKRFA